MEDIEIVELFLQRNEDAVKYTEQKYTTYCFTIAKQILNSHEDSEESVNETWFAAWNSIPPQIPECLRTFLGKITRNICFIDKNGKFVIEPQYSDWSELGSSGFQHYYGAGSFSNGIAQVAVKDGDEPAKWGYINSKGETILPLEYDNAFGSDGTYFSVGKTVDGAVKYGVVDQNGNTVLPFIFEDVTTPVNGTVYAFYNRELYSFIISKANLESGDLDGDGEIGAEDAQNVLTLYAESVAGNEPRLTDAQKKAADVNGDGTIDVADAQLILLYYVQNTVTGIPTDWKDLIS